jgi:hypothetical protein
MSGDAGAELRQAIDITFKDFARPNGGVGLTAGEIDDLVRDLQRQPRAEAWRAANPAWLVRFRR